MIRINFVFQICFWWIITIYSADSFQKRSFESALIQSGQSLIINGIPSVSRLFFVKIGKWNLDGSNSGNFVCGGAVIAEYWVVTAFHCVSDSTAADIYVDIGDFSKQQNPLNTVQVTKIIRPLEYTQEGSIQKNDIALLKLWRKQDTKIELCKSEDFSGTIMGTCGLGSTSQTQLVFPDLLMETNLRISWFEDLSMFRITECDPSLVCTENLGDDSNICVMDSGSPLYALKCNDGIAHDCLYGVASYFKNKNERSGSMCDGGSYFTKIPYFYNWIQHAMANF